jgi:hypothetical protein
VNLPPGGFSTLASELLRQRQGVRCRTAGSSMFPLIRSGSVVQVEPVALESLRRGDVILFRAGDALVAHRLVDQGRGGGAGRLATRGDAFPRRVIEEVDPSQVLGRVVAIQRGPWQIRIDAGLGRLCSTMLAALSPVLRLGYPALRYLRNRWQTASGTATGTP